MEKNLIIWIFDKCIYHANHYYYETVIVCPAGKIVGAKDAHRSVSLNTRKRSVYMRITNKIAFEL